MKTIEQEMRGKVGVITGGNTGIGFGCAEVFCEAGMNVVIAARREEKGEKAAKEIHARGGGKCRFKKCDVSKPEEVEALIEYTVSEFGRLDTMVNNAGYVPPHLDACDMPDRELPRCSCNKSFGHVLWMQIRDSAFTRHTRQHHQYVQHTGCGWTGTDGGVFVDKRRDNGHDEDDRH